MRAGARGGIRTDEPGSTALSDSGSGTAESGASDPYHGDQQGLTPEPESKGGREVGAEETRPGAPANTISAQWELPPDLQAVAEAWPTLPQAVKAGILAMVEAARG